MRVSTSTSIKMVLASFAMVIMSGPAMAGPLTCPAGDPECPHTIPHAKPQEKCTPGDPLCTDGLRKPQEKTTTKSAPQKSTNGTSSQSPK